MNSRFFALLTLAAANILLGCGAFKSSMKYQRSSVIAQDNAHAYKRLPDNAVGEPIGDLRKGDTIPTLGRIRDSWNGNHIYLIMFNGDTALTRRPDVEPEWVIEKSTFTLPMSQDKDAWARANYYVSNNADMKIQVANEYLIETYNSPKGESKTTFTINRLPQGDNVQYTVSSSSPMQEKKCARFIRTGSVPPDWDY